MRASMPLPAATFARRFGSPGALYNLGNVLGFTIGLSIAVVKTPQIDWTWQSIRGSAFLYVAGTPSALMITLATSIFFLSGELYAKAYAAHGSTASRTAAIKRADFCSGVGAVALGLGLYLLDHTALAVVAGVLHAGGKFGSVALVRSAATNTLSFFRDLFRCAVLASRVPGVAVALMTLSAGGAASGALDVVMPITMLACYLLWGAADTLLLLNERPFHR